MLLIRSSRVRHVPICRILNIGQCLPLHSTHAVYYCLSGNSWCCSTGAPDFSPIINTTCCSISNLEFDATSPTVYTQAALNFVSTISGASPTKTASLSTHSTSSAPTETSSVSTSPSPSSTSSSSSGSSKTGIYVGVPLGIILALALGIIAWLVWRKRRRTSQPQELANNTQRVEKQQWFMQPSELPNNQPAAIELSNTHHSYQTHHNYQMAK